MTIKMIVKSVRPSGHEIKEFSVEFNAPMSDAELLRKISAFVNSIPSRKKA